MEACQACVELPESTGDKSASSGQLDHPLEQPLRHQRWRMLQEGRPLGQTLEQPLRTVGPLGQPLVQPPPPSRAGASNLVQTSVSSELQPTRTRQA